MNKVFIIFFILISLGNAETISNLKIPNGSILIDRVLNKNDYRKNPDGTKFYETKLNITINHNNKKRSKELITNLYTHKNTSWNGMKPSMIYDPEKNILTIFVNGKTKKYDYGMEGYAFRFEMGSKKWKKEKIFNNANWGWYSFFEGSKKGQPILWHFSYAGYYAMKSVRHSNGNWSNDNFGNISPKNAKKIHTNSHNILIASTVGHQRMKNNEKNYNNNNNDAIAIGVATVVGYGLYKLFTWEPSYTSNNTNYTSNLKYGCKFCCEGQFGNCRSQKFQVNTPYSNSSDAQNYIRKQYKDTCNKYPFYNGGGGSASVSYPYCETYYYSN